MIGEIILSFVLEKVGDLGLNALRNQYDPLARRAAERTADQLKLKHGDSFVEIFGSRNFVEELPLFDSPQFREGLCATRDGKWELDEAKISAALVERVQEKGGQLADHAEELVTLFFENFRSVLRSEDPDALTRRIYVTAEETYDATLDIQRGVQQLLAQYHSFKAQLQSIASGQTEIAAIKDQLRQTQRLHCESELKRSDVLIASYKFEDAKQAVLAVENDVKALCDPKLTGRFYNALAQSETWQGNRLSAEALEYLTAASSHWPENAVIKVNLGVYHYNSGDTSNAKKCISSVDSSSQNFANYFNLKGLIEVRDQRLNEAKAAFERALELDNSFFEARGNLGRLYIDFGQIKEAETTYTELYKLNPRSLSACIGLGNISFERANRLLPGTPEDQANLEIAKHWYETGLNVLKVMGIADKYVADDMAILLGNLGGVEAALGYFEDGESHLKRSIELRPKEPNAHFNLGQLYHRLNRYGEAFSELEITRRLGREDELTLVNMGGMCMALFNERGEDEYLQEAEVIFTSLLETQPCSLALENLCNVYFLTKRPDQVRYICERVLDQVPKCEHALGSLILFHRKFGDSGKAVDLLTQLLEINPDNFDANFDLGASAFKDKQWTDALPPLLRCAKPSLLTSNLLPEVHLMLAECYSRLNKPDDAFQALSAGLGRFPRNKKLLEKVSSLAKVRLDRPPTLFVPRSVLPNLRK